MRMVVVGGKERAGRRARLDAGGVNTRKHALARVIVRPLAFGHVEQAEHSSVSGVKASVRRDTEDASRRANGRVAFWFTRARRARVNHAPCPMSMNTARHREFSSRDQIGNISY